MLPERDEYNNNVVIPAVKLQEIYEYLNDQKRSETNELCLILESKLPTVGGFVKNVEEYYAPKKEQKDVKDES